VTEIVLFPFDDRFELVIAWIYKTSALAKLVAVVLGLSSMLTAISCIEITILQKKVK
jgi:hypothetical protein